MNDVHFSRHVHVLGAGLLLFLALTGCATSSAPDLWIPEAENVDEQAFGGWIEITRDKSVYDAPYVFGELLAVEDDSAVVLGVSLSSSDSIDWTSIPEPVVHVIPLNSIERARLFWYDSEWGDMALWTTAGILSTASHGFGLILSAPIWLITGSVATRSQSRMPLVTYPDRPWHAFIPFARFPQGLPSGLNSALIQPKQFVSSTGSKK